MRLAWRYEGARPEVWAISVLARAARRTAWPVERAVDAMWGWEKSCKLGNYDVGGLQEMEVKTNVGRDIDVGNGGFKSEVGLTTGDVGICVMRVPLHKALAPRRWGARSALLLSSARMFAPPDWALVSRGSEIHPDLSNRPKQFCG